MQTEMLDRELQQQIERYRTTTRRGRCETQKGAKVARYATATASAMALAGGAEASVIYSGVQNITIQTDPDQLSAPASLLIDLDGAFGNDVRLHLFWYTYSRVSGGAYGNYFFYTNEAWAAFGGFAPNPAGILVNASNHVQRLSSGATISSGAAFRAGGFNVMNHYTEFSPAQERGTWTGNATGIAGIALDRGGDTHYGWIRLQLEDLSSYNGGPEGASDKLTVVDWAWESVPGRAIQAGATVPEPSSFGLLAAGAAAALVWERRRERRRQKAEAVE